MSAAIEMERFVTRVEAATLLSMSPNYLAKLTCWRRGPKVSKYGTADRSPVRYRVADCLDWAANPEAHERRVWGDSKAAKRNARRQKAGRK